MQGLKRPIGIWVCSFVIAVWGVKSAFAIASFRKVLVTLNLDVADMLRLYWIIGLVIVCFAVAGGLLALKPWARVTGILLAALMFVESLYVLFGPAAESPESPMPAMAYRLTSLPVFVVCLIVFYFLGSDPETKAAFKSESLF